MNRYHPLKHVLLKIDPEQTIRFPLEIEILREMDMPKPSLAYVSLDQQKAFDCVDHDFLIQML